jgi:hypothetical protein
VKALYQVLSSVVSALHEVKFTEWVANCGKGVSFHSGWLPLLHLRVKLIKKAVDGPLILGSEENHYKVKCLDSSLTQSLEGILSMHDEVSDIEVPQTCQAWSSAVDTLMECFKVHPELTGKTDGYSKLWLARSFLFSLMRSHSPPVKALALGGISANRFANMFPDQSEWIHLLTARSGVEQSFKDLGYKGPPELFSMNACLFNHPQMDLCPQYLHENRVCLQKKVREYKELHGMVPHPAVLAGLLGPEASAKS